MKVVFYCARGLDSKLSDQEFVEKVFLQIRDLIDFTFIKKIDSSSSTSHGTQFMVEFKLKADADINLKAAIRLISVALDSKHNSPLNITGIDIDGPLTPAISAIPCSIEDKQAVKENMLESYRVDVNFAMAVLNDKSLLGRMLNNEVDSVSIVKSRTSESDTPEMEIVYNEKSKNGKDKRLNPYTAFAQLLNEKYDPEFPFRGYMQCGCLATFTFHVTQKLRCPGGGTYTRNSNKMPLSTSGSSIEDIYGPVVKMIKGRKGVDTYSFSMAFVTSIVESPTVYNAIRSHNYTTEHKIGGTLFSSTTKQFRKGGHPIRILAEMIRQDKSLVEMVRAGMIQHIDLEINSKDPTNTALNLTYMEGKLEGLQQESIKHRPA